MKKKRRLEIRETSGNLKKKTHNIQAVEKVLVPLGPSWEYCISSTISNQIVTILELKRKPGFQNHWQSGYDPGVKVEIEGFFWTWYFRQNSHKLPRLVLNSICTPIWDLLASPSGGPGSTDLGPSLYVTLLKPRHLTLTWSLSAILSLISSASPVSTALSKQSIFVV